jgi:hypothetical protein
MIHFVALQTQRIGSTLFGIIIPAVIFVISFLAAWLIYRHFSKSVKKDT